MKPAILGGPPAFAEPVAWVRPTLPALDEIAGPLADALGRGQITNGGRYVQAFEAALETYLSAHCVCVASGTAGLGLVASCLAPRRGVLVPAFTFPATALAFAPATERLLLADVADDTWCLDPGQARAAAGEVDALVPVNVYGHPPDVDALDALARDGRAVVYDSAHGLGSRWRGRRVGGFGSAEVFSLHATKVLGCGEGGVVSTRDEALARELRHRRNFGLDGPVSRWRGTNAKMAEFSAVLGLWGLPRLDGWIERRGAVVETYRSSLGALPGLGTQRPSPHAASSHVNFAIVVGAAFGLSRDGLARALAADGVMTRAYFSPDLTGHPSLAAAAVTPGGPGRARRLGREVLCLPLASHQREDEARAIADCVCRIHDHRAAVRARLAEEDPP